MITFGTKVRDTEGALHGGAEEVLRPIVAHCGASSVRLETGHCQEMAESQAAATKARNSSTKGRIHVSHPRRGARRFLSDGSREGAGTVAGTCSRGTAREWRVPSGCLTSHFPAHLGRRLQRL